MTTTPRLWKSLTQVNTSDASVVPGGTNFQGDGQIARLPDGGYVVVWTDDSFTYNPIGSAIVGQRYDSAGNKVGGEVNLSLFGFGDQSSPAVTVLANGNIAVAFVHSNLGDDDINVHVFNPSLGFVRNDIIDTGASQTVDPSLTAFADGSYVVSYTVGSGADTDIVARIVSAAGVVGGQFDIDNQSDNRNFSELATLSNGNFVVVYEDEFNGSASDHDIKYGIFSKTGIPVTVGQSVPGGDGAGFETDPDVAALRDGGFVVVWTDPDGSSPPNIRASILSNTGGPVFSDFFVHTAATSDGVQNEASVVALADGGFLVTWEDHSVPFAILVRAQRFDAVAHMIGSEFTVKNGVTPFSPEAAVLTDGRIAYAVGDASTGDADVMTSIWTTGWNAVASGDFNGDGTTDILWQNAVGGTSEWLMSPSGGIASFPFTPPAAGWDVVASGDLNGDGTDDILWKNDATGSTAEWLMAPTGGASLLGTPAAPGWDVVASGDFNGDHITDIMWKHAATGSTAEWLMAPTGGVGSLLSAPPVGGWIVVATGDFNNDGTTDIMWEHAATGSTAEWLMAPTGGVGSLLSAPPVGGWGVVATGDFNNDGTTDLMWQHSMTGATAEWLMAPTGGVGSLLGAPPAGGWNLIASGDFNGDGTDDVMWQNAATGATSEWLMAGGGVASNPFTPAAPGWDVVATGDLNGDARIDLMWQNALTGATAEWLMAPGGGVGAFVATLMT
jgi:FG-GAP-like repeat